MAEHPPSALPSYSEAIYKRPNPDGSRQACSNCVAEDELVLINGIPAPIGHVLEGQTLTERGWASIDGAVHRNKQNVVEVRSVSGLRIRVTPDHKFHTDQGWVAAIDLKHGRKAHVLTTLLDGPMEKRDRISRKEALLIGAITGDGWINNNYGVGFGFPESMANAWKPLLTFARERFGSRESLRLAAPSGYALRDPTSTHEPFYMINWRNKAAKTFAALVDKNRVPKEVWKSTLECAGSYLRGLFSTDGSICSGKDPRHSSLTLNVVFFNTRKRLVDEVRLLLRMMGMPSSLTKYTRQPKYKDLYAVTLSRKFALERFQNLIGFLDRRRQALLEEGLQVKKGREFIDRVRSVVPAGKSDVVDISVPSTKSFFASGFLVHNCMMFVKGENKCVIHPKDLTVRSHYWCNYHVFGKSMDKWMDHPGMQAVDPAFSGLRLAGGGIACDNCVYYVPRAEQEGICTALVKEVGGTELAPVAPLAICARHRVS